MSSGAEVISSTEHRLTEILTSRRNLIILLAGLFLASLIIRLLYAGIIEDPGRPLEGDEGAYQWRAERFTDGEWGHSSERPPLLGFQLAIFYMFTGPELTVGRLAVAFYSSLVAPIVFLVGRRFLESSLAALIVAAAWVMYPPSVFYSGQILTETGSALLMLASFGAFLWATQSRSIWPVVLTGILWGLLAQNRALFLLVPFTLLAGQLMLSRFGEINWQLPMKRWAIALIAFVGVLTPWTIHNAIEHGKFIPHSTQGGYVLLITNGRLDHPKVQAGSYYRDPEQMAIRETGATEVEQDSISRGLAIEEIRNNLRLLPGAVINRAKNFWIPRADPYSPTWTTNDSIMLLIWTPTLVLFLVSFGLISWKRYWPGLVLIALTFFLVLPFWGTPRFRYPVDPIIVMGASFALVELARRAAPALQRLKSGTSVPVESGN